MRVAAVLVVIAAAASSSAAEAAKQQEGAATVKVAFLQGEQLVYLERRGANLRAALTALLAGPTKAEGKRDIKSQIPVGSTLRSVSVKNGVASVDLGERFALGTRAESLSARVAQVVLTATRSPGVRSVQPAGEGRHAARALPGRRDAVPIDGESGAGAHAPASGAACDAAAHGAVTGHAFVAAEPGCARPSRR